jgi:hypothetical protein
MDFQEFTTIDFSPINAGEPGFVYVLFYREKELDIPFYVGQTTRIWGRFDDYYWAMFSAATDFRVGEAIRYLHEKGLKITAKYKCSHKELDDRLKEERALIEKLQNEGYSLLNDQGSFKYKETDALQERTKVHKFFDKLL